MLVHTVYDAQEMVMRKRGQQALGFILLDSY